MRILLTGASGFIGKHSLRKLISSGHDVHALSLHDREQGVVAVNVADSEELRKHCGHKRYDAILHLAANIPSEYGLSSCDAMMTDITMTRNILGLAMVHNSHVVYASSTVVYGYPKRIPVEEDDLLDPRTFYSLSKQIGEMLCQQYARTYNLQATVLRLSAPYGPGMSSRAVIAKFVNQALSGGKIAVFGTGSRSQDFTYIRDVVAAFESVLHSGATGVFNIGTGVPTTMHDLARTVVEVTGRQPSIVSFSNTEDPQEQYRMAVRLDAANKAFGYVPVYSLKRGIEEYVEQQKR